jgi:translation initiation factor 3 subunit L
VCPFPFSPICHLWGTQPSACIYSDEGLPAFEELFLYACPKFISANPPPYQDQEQLAAYAEDLPSEPAQRHLALFLADVRAQAAVPTLRSFLKLYTSLDAAKLAGFLDADEEEMVQQMMAVKAASRSVSRVGNERNLLDGQMISTSDMDFVINEVRPGRRGHRCPS